VACQRLANGNTFIATYSNVLEVTPAGTEVFNFNPNPVAGGVIYDARKLANGNVVCISGRGTLLELDQTGKQVRSLPISNQGGWAGVTPLPGGRFLVALLGPGRVVEVDGDGKVLWEAAVPTAAHAIRLPSGNTLVACMNAQRLVEINPAGSVVWEQKTPGRPFHIGRR
jgi:outer membrane protein assembly factor BamB